MDATIAVVVGALAVAFSVLVALAYNYFVVLDQRRLQAEGDVSAQLNQRWDVVAQMARLVGRYMSHEATVLQDLTQARAREGMAAVSGEEMDSKLRATMAGLFARAEAYPELRADSTFVRMQHAVEESEAQLAAARRMLNAAIAQYNSAVRQFPLNILAGVFGFRPAVYVGHPAEAATRPEPLGI